jgi:hypothetical protein
MANPVVTTLFTEIDSNTSKYCDLSQMASIVNRKFIRQGLNWAVSGFTLISQPSASGSVRIQKLPDTWVMANAWVKGFKAWQRMNREALSETESVRPKFLDFKVYMDDTHHDAGFIANALPVATDTNAPFVRGDWDSSKFVYPDTDTPGTIENMECICVGGNFQGASTATGLNAVSLIEGYAASRLLPDVFSPNTPDDAADIEGSTPENWLQAIFNEGTDQASAVVSDMITENIQAPYPFENDLVHTDTMYPNGANQPNTGGVGGALELHDLVDIQSGNTVGNRTFMRGGNFQCGLLKIDNNTGQKLEVMIHLVRGRGSAGRGYLAMPMQDVN